MVFTERCSRPEISLHVPPRRDEQQHVVLSGRQQVELGVGGRGDLAGEGVEDDPGEPRREDRVEQVGRRDRPGDVAAGARADDGDDVLGVVRHRQREEPHAGPCAVHRGDHRLAAVGQVDVEQHDVGVLGADQGDRGLDGAGLADDRDRVVEARPQSGAEDLVVVDQHDAAHRAVSAT